MNIAEYIELTFYDSLESYILEDQKCIDAALLNIKDKIVLEYPLVKNKLSISDVSLKVTKMTFESHTLGLYPETVDFSVWAQIIKEEHPEVLV